MSQHFNYTLAEARQTHKTLSLFRICWICELSVDQRLQSRDPSIVLLNLTPQ